MGKLKMKLPSHWGSGQAFLSSQGKYGLKNILEMIIDHVDDVGAEDVKDWIHMNDVGVQFAGGVEGKNGFGVANNYIGAPGTPVEVNLEVTDGDGTNNIINESSTVEVSITGGTAPGATIDGGAGPVTVTFTNGKVSVMINATGAGTVLLGLSSPTHPKVTLDVSDTAIVTLS